MDSIVVENLKYRYPSSEHLVLNNITFKLKKGEILGIIGKNKSGKSTLAQALVGLVPHFYKGAYGGNVYINGLEVMNTSVSELSRRVGIVFQNPFNQITGSKLTVYEEIAFGLENFGFNRKDIINKVDYVLDLLGLTNHKSKNPFELSGGLMQKLAIASVLAIKPDIVILDEPTSQLDPHGSEEVFLAINKLKNEGITIVLIEHKIEKMASYCDKIMILNNGECVDIDIPNKIFSRDDLLDYGLNYPVYTQVCRELGLKNENNLYPVTLDETYEIMVSKYGND